MADGALCPIRINSTAERSRSLQYWSWCRTKIDQSSAWRRHDGGQSWPVESRNRWYGRWRRHQVRRGNESVQDLRREKAEQEVGPFVDSSGLCVLGLPGRDRAFSVLCLPLEPEYAAGQQHGKHTGEFPSSADLDSRDHFHFDAEYSISWRCDRE